MMAAGAAVCQTRQDAQLRMDRARAVQVEWGRTPVEQRARALRPLRLAIAERVDEILSVICEEVGKPPMDALAGDIMVTLEQLSFYERRPPRSENSARVLGG